MFNAITPLDKLKNLKEHMEKVFTAIHWNYQHRLNLYKINS